MNSCTANFDSYEGIECSDSELERLKTGNLVWEDMKGAIMRPQTCQWGGLPCLDETKHQTGSA